MYGNHWDHHLDYVGATASVDDVVVSVAHWSSVRLVGEVGRALGEGGHPPVESLRRAGVAPAAAVSVEAAECRLPSPR